MSDLEGPAQPSGAGPAEDPAALKAQHLFERAYAELRSIARALLRSERIDHTLQATALVHEAWLRLARTEGQRESGAIGARALMARVMRQVLIDHARAAHGAKRGDGWRRVSLDAAESVTDADATYVDLLDLDSALNALAEIRPRHARVVELRYFGGMTQDEAADALGVSVATVEMDWRLARAWLRARLAATRAGAVS